MFLRLFGRKNIIIIINKEKKERNASNHNIMTLDDLRG